MRQANKRRAPARKQPRQQELAKERVARLFGLAGGAFREDPSRADRYVGLARKIALRHNIRFTKEQKMRFCKSCGRYLVPGASSSVRASRKQEAVIVRCLKCGHVMRYPYRREKRI